MSDLDQLAQTIATDFTAAVKTATRERQAQIDDIVQKLDEADRARDVGLLEVRRLREEAAKLVAQSLKLEEEISGEHAAEGQAIRHALNAMRGPQAISGKPKVMRLHARTTE